MPLSSPSAETRRKEKDPQRRCRESRRMLGQGLPGRQQDAYRQESLRQARLPGKRGMFVTIAAMTWFVGDG